MNARRLLALAFVILFLALPLKTVHADGIIIPPPCPLEGCPPPPCFVAPCPPIPPRPMTQLVIRYHHVTVDIVDQVATTRVDQVFYNPNDYAVEGTYIFPLPEGAVVDNFLLWIDGEPVQGKVLEAAEARKIYEEIVYSLQDPALLEYVGRGAVQASVFPIPPQGERRIELQYSQVLTAENGLVHYSYPLNTEKFSLQPLESVSVTVNSSGKTPVRAVYSPSHPIDVTRDGQTDFTASWEDKNVLPDSDFDLYYSLGETEALHLMTFRDPTDPEEQDGFFLMLLAPRPEAPDRRIAKDVLLVLDRSGSMEGEKFRQAQEALRFILNHLDPEDRFHLLTFSSGVESYASGLRSAKEAPEALRWVDQLSASGSTDINRALLESAAVADPERPTYLIFLTDGLPTVGEVDSQRILANFAASARENLRVFPFGVGYDVDTYLLDTLSSENHGLSSYVRPEEALDEALSAFYERISTPVLTNLSIDFGEISTYDVYPNPLPDLFAGQQVLVVGRYRDSGSATITLRGEVNGEAQTLTFRDQAFAESGGLEALPRLWAARKIGYLLNQVRLQGPGPETIAQIVRLSVRYGIITEYTSYLVTEDLPLSASAQEKMAEEAYQDAQAPAPSSGQGAVERSAQEGQLQAAESAPMNMDTGERVIRAVGPRTFILQDGIWTDTAFESESMAPLKIGFLSPEYFQLLTDRPDLAAALALGQRVIVVAGGQAYSIEGEGASQPGMTLDAPTATPEPDAPEVTPQPTRAPDSTPAPAVCGSAVLPLGLFLLVLRRK
ncbi:MAG: VWA domain-containing protein [Anaerolineaceae bacterium]|nr:VWA domain-containing protein [Anaerolineaceae bacterium]